MKPIKAFFILLVLSISLTGFSNNSDQNDNSKVETIKIINDTCIDASCVIAKVETKIKKRKKNRNMFNDFQTQTLHLNGCEFLAKPIALPLPLKFRQNSQGVVNNKQLELDKENFLMSEEYLFGSLLFIANENDFDAPVISAKLSSRETPITDDNFDLFLKFSKSNTEFKDVLFDKLNIYAEQSEFGFSEWYTKTVYFSGYILREKK